MKKYKETDIILQEYKNDLDIIKDMEKLFFYNNDNIIQEKLDILWDELSKRAELNRLNNV